MNISIEKAGWKLLNKGGAGNVHSHGHWELLKDLISALSRLCLNMSQQQVTEPQSLESLLPCFMSRTLVGLFFSCSLLLSRVAFWMIFCSFLACVLLPNRHACWECTSTANVMDASRRWRSSSRKSKALSTLLSSFFTFREIYQYPLSCECSGKVIFL